LGLSYVTLSVSCRKRRASVVDEMKWNQPLLRGMPRLVDDIGREANKREVVKRGLANVGQWKATGRRHGDCRSAI
jgi:hypothetical protein